MKQKYQLLFHCTIVPLVLASSAIGAEKTYDGGTSGTGTAWRTGTNWSGDTAPGALDNVVMGNAGGSAQTLTGQAVTEITTIQDITFTNTISRSLENSTTVASRPSVLVLAGGRSGNSNLISATGSALFTIRNGDTSSLELRLGTSGNVNVGTGSSLSLLGAITGSGGFTKTGSGSLLIGQLTVLDGVAQTYSGGFTVAEGLVRTNVSSTRSGTTITNGPFGTGVLTLQGGTLRSNTATNRTYHNAVRLNGSITLGGTDTGTQTFSALTNGTTSLQANSNLETVTDTIWSQAITASNSSYSLSKSGSASLTLNAAGTWNTTTVSAGTLFVNNTLTINSMTVASTATVGGTGSISGTTSVAGTLAAGNGAGTIALQNLGFTSSAHLSFELTGGATLGASDLVDVSGSLGLGDAILDLVQLGAYTVGNKVTLFAYDGPLSGTFAGLGDGDEFTAAGGAWVIDYDDDEAGENGGTGNSFVTITAVPEPAAALLGGLGTLLLISRRRKF